MKSIATMALKPGMVLGEDVLSYKNEMLLPANTVLDDISIAKLSRHSIMCVPIKEPEDFATTHFEKIRLSYGFKHFSQTYNIYMPVYKKMIDGVVFDNKAPDFQTLYQVFAELTGCARTGETLLDYLYNMTPSEDDMTYAHCLNSALIAGVFGTWLSLPRNDMFLLIYCGFLYDIGKIVLPPEILWKPTKLTAIEFERVKTHTMNGFNILKDHNLDENIIKATLMHHERCDGTGYPSKLKEDQINLFAKYISIIDAYEAMTSARTYRQSLTPLQVVGNFEDTSRYYSSIILNPILKHIAQSQLGMTVRLNDERLAEIILINDQKLSRPLLKCGDEIIDMSKSPDLSIIAVL